MPQQVNPPKPAKQVTLTTSAQSLQTLLGDSAAYVNWGGFQLKGLAANTTSAFWNTTAATDTAIIGDEIAPGTAQLITPAQCKDTANCFLIGASGGEVICVSFPGG